MNDKSGNVAFREINDMPEYEFKLVNKGKETDDDLVMAAIDSLTTTTYKVFAVTMDGENKTVVKDQEEAERIIANLKSDLKEDVELNLGIVGVYNSTLDVDTEEKATQILTEIKTTKIEEFNNKKIEEENKKKEEEKKRLRARNGSYVSTETLASTGNISGLQLSIPINGMISSRFGSRDAKRSTVHTGLDIASSNGAPISPIAAGTVTFAAYNGSYGNCIKIDHGNGIESWYAHCSYINVTVGQQVAPGTVIGGVGSTGNSTGPHLHLEIRSNGVAVNPQNYLYN